jgi:hypothetical protein
VAARQAAARLVRSGELIIVDHDGRQYRYGAPEPGRAPVQVRLTDPARRLRHRT